MKEKRTLYNGKHKRTLALNGEQNVIMVYDNYGIRSSGSNLTLYNNHISYYDGILSQSCFPSCDGPYNVYVTGGALEHTLVIGGEGDGESNEIENGYFGIYAQNNLNVFINYNTLYNINKSVMVSKLNVPGISSGHLIEVKNNTITDCYNGINITASEHAGITINTNIIHLADNAQSKIGPTGIAVIEPVGGYLPDDETTVMISNNDIEGVQNGIFINSLGSPTTIQQNDIEFDVKSEFLVFKAYGIHVIKTEDILIQANENITSIDGGENTRGIQVDNSNYYTIKSNSISNCGRGIVANGIGTMGVNTFITCNDLFECTYGFLLDHDANIGPQGNSTHPSNNTWTPNGYYDVSNANGAVHTWSGSFAGSSSPFFTLNGNIYLIDNYGADTNKDPVTSIIVSSGSDYCPEIYDPPVELFEDITEGLINYGGDSIKAKWLAKQALFNLLRRDTTLVDSSIILSNFYDTTLLNNIGKIRDVRTQIRRGVYEVDTDYFDDADYENSILSTINDLDGNHKLVNEIYLNSLIAVVDTFTEDEIEDLEAIAQMCYEDGGVAAYHAMALLSYAYKTPVFYDCEVTEEKSSKPSKTDFILGAVYPNPTAWSITIENYCTEDVMHAELVNQIGKQVLKFTIPQGPSQQTISLTLLPAGVYIIHLSGCESKIVQLIVKTQ